jgi:ubiquinol-cytochrome c reductase cytochrome b subunit
VRVLTWLRVASAVLCLLFLVLLLTSGWALMANYVASDSEAFSSVLFLRQDTAGGSQLRSVHYSLSSAVVVAGFFYLLFTYLLGSHITEKTLWWSGVGLYLLLLAMCFTGFLLPMDQNAYWGTVVRLGIVETVPVLGPHLSQMLRGGQTFNASTLPRFYALHVAVLPFLCTLPLTFLLKGFVGRLGSNRQRALLLIVGLAGLLVVFVVASLPRAPLELRADSIDSEYVPRPEWYFLWLFQLGKYVETAPWVQSLIVPVVGVGLLFALPMLSRQRLRGRIILASGWVAVWLVLTALALYEDRELPPKPSYELAMAERAAEAWEELCRECHGAEGRGDGARSRKFGLDARDFTQAAIWLEVSREEMFRSIRDGKGKDMPGFRRQLKQDEIDAVLAFMKTNFAPEEP